MRSRIIRFLVPPVCGYEVIRGESNLLSPSLCPGGLYLSILRREASVPTGLGCAVDVSIKPDAKGGGELHDFSSARAPAAQTVAGKTAEAIAALQFSLFMMSSRERSCVPVRGCSSR
jgi:hypothetical protein